MKTWRLTRSMLLSALLGCFLHEALAYDLGNYRRDMDEANRQRMANEFRRDAQTRERRNEELRSRNTYQPAASGSSVGAGSGTRAASGAAAYSAPSSAGDAPAIESSKTVTVRVKESESETVQRILKEAAAGQGEAQWNAGRLYFTGGYGGIARDDAKAAEWFRKAAEAGHPAAAQAYGEMLFGGKGVPENAAEAGKWFKFAAEKGIPRAMFFWGTLLEVGHTVSRDDQAAFGWFKKAAEAQESHAYAALGNMYLSGRGTSINLAEAVRWLALGAESGDAAASVDLGGLYVQGKGVPKNEAEAGRLFIKGAEGGNKNGMINAGIMYEQGVLGVSQDLGKARYWYEKAGAAGDEQARKAAERLAAAPSAASRNADAPTLPAEASSQGKYDGLLQALHCPSDKGTYGNFTDYGYWSGGPWCGQQGKGGYWVWVAPTWYVWSKKVR